jgi:hypothetical protein
MGVTRLRAPAKAAEGTTKVKSYYYFLIGSAGIGYGLRLRPALPRLEGIQWVQCLSIMSKTAPEGAAVHIAVTERAYSGFSRQQKTRTRRA